MALGRCRTAVGIISPHNMKMNCAKTCSSSTRVEMGVSEEDRAAAAPRRPAAFSSPKIIFLHDTRSFVMDHIRDFKVVTTTRPDY